MNDRRETIEADLVSRGDPHEIMRRLVTLAARTADADRCTLTSIDQHVFRVEASYEVGGPPDFVGREYPLTYVSRQPLLREAITSGTIVIGGSFGRGAQVDPALAPALLEVLHTGIVPLSIGNSVGAVLILSRKSNKPFVAQDLEGLQQFGVLAVLALRVEALQAAEVKRLEAHAARMAELDQQKSEFLQLASHELRAPITLVSGYLSMLEDGSLGVLPESAAKVVPLMTTRMRQMTQLVERMLAASRMEVRRRDAPLVAVRIDDVARAVVASQTMDEDARHIGVQASAPLYVRADPESVETMLNNLVSNALKYSAANSDIAVVVREEPGWAVVDVIDQGIGITRQEMAKLFQPFGRLESALSAGIEGTGLGLHLSRNLALSFGGDIEVHSRPGKGSTFTLRLPMQPSTATARAGA